MVITFLAYWSDPLLRYHTLKFTTKRHGHLVFSSLSMKGEGFKTHKLGWTVANGKESVSSYLEQMVRWTGASDFGTPLGGFVVDVFWCFVFSIRGHWNRLFHRSFSGGDMSPSSRLESFTRSWLGVVVSCSRCSVPQGVGRINLDQLSRLLGNNVSQQKSCI